MGDFCIMGKSDSDSGKTALVGLTGGIGCGQSTVAGFFEKWGCKVINADRIGHQILNNDKEARKELRQVFGRDIFYRNGKVNRKLLAEEVFPDLYKTEQLNSIVHPLMAARIVEELESARFSGKYPLVVLDAALLYEVQMETLFDAVIVVAARIGVRLERIKERDGLSDEDIRSRIARQMPIESKTQWADYTLHNNSDVDKLEEKARKLFEDLTRRFGGRQKEERRSEGKGPEAGGGKSRGRRRGGRRRGRGKGDSGPASGSGSGGEKTN